MKIHNQPLTPFQDQSLSPAALAARWECSVVTVKRRIKAGQIHSHKNGRLVRIPLSEILRFETEITV
jgi:excisionase family DNA binding protein